MKLKLLRVFSPYVIKAEVTQFGNDVVKKKLEKEEKNMHRTVTLNDLLRELDGLELGTSLIKCGAAQCTHRS